MTRVISKVRLCPFVKYYASDVTRIALDLNTPAHFFSDEVQTRGT